MHHYQKSYKICDTNLVSKLKNIFLIASPLQVICAYEFSKKYLAYKNIICPIYINGADLRNKQIKNTIEFFKFENIENIYIGNSFLSKVNQIHTVCKFIFLRLKLGGGNYRLIFGDFRDKSMHIARIFFKPKEAFVIDDGFASYLAGEKYLSKSIFLPKLNKFEEFILRILRHYKYLKDSKVSLFSVYSELLIGDIFLQNDFLSVRKKIKYKNINYDENLAFYLGTKLSERGALSLDDEIKILKSSLIYIQSIGKKCIYFAKRSTSKKKLDLIEALGYKIYIPEYPLELYLMNSEDLPSLICGFGSSVFSNLPKLFPDLKSLILQYPIKVFRKKSDIYEYNTFLEIFKNQPIEIINIDI